MYEYLKSTPENIQQAAEIMRDALLNDDAMYDALLDCIECALREAPAEPGFRRVAEAVAVQLIGTED